MIRTASLITAALLLSACDSATGPTTTTKLDAVEVEPGTASDAMILLDDSDIDGTTVDTSGALTAEGAAAAKAEAAKAAPVAAAEGEETSAEDAADAPDTPTE
jgi:ribosomal protein L12E/L44/L45/RPP1/RPP2